MIIDPQDTRKISRSWGEYLHEMKESLGVAKWVYQEFITPESRRWTRRMLIALAISITALNKIEMNAIQISMTATTIEMSGAKVSITSAGPCSVQGLPIQLN